MSARLGRARMPAQRAHERLRHARAARGRQTRRARARTCRRSRRAQRAAGARAPSAPTLTAVARLELELVGAGGEPVDFWRTVNSHGFNDLVPNRIDSVERTLELTLYPGPQTVLVRKSGPTSVTVEGRAPRRVAGAVRHVLRLDEDLSRALRQLAEDPALAWAAQGAGRWMRSQSGLRGRREDDLHDELRVVGHGADGEHARPAARRGVGPRSARVSDGREDGCKARALVPRRRAGRLPRAYLRSLASSVASGELDLEALAADHELDDDEVAARLLELPGVGPYAAAHIMMLIGRYSRLVLDSWTRPTYARLNGRKAADSTIERRFRASGPTPGSPSGSS